MATDKEFAQAALRHRFVKPDDMRGALAQAQRTGRAVPGVLVERGLLNPALVGRVHELVAESKKPPKLGNFEILAKIAEGGMGTVYRARQTSLDRVVALKLLKRELSRDKAYVARFLREAKLAGSLSHPNIVGAYEAGASRGYHYFAMEFVEGRSVGQILEEGPPIPEEEALDIVRQMADALDYAHEHNMIHRDIKPDNILLTSDGTAKLADLGLARSTAADATRVTQSGVAVGTPHYISPEQARGERDLDIRADIYSLGATLYHMVTGNTPFSGGTAAVVITKHLTEPLRPANQVNPAVSEGTVAIIARMMAKRREERYATPRELLEEFERLARGEEPLALRRTLADLDAREVGRAQKRRAETVRALSRGQKRAFPYGWVVAAVGGALVVAVALFVQYGGAERASEEAASRIERLLRDGRAAEALVELKKARLLFPRDPRLVELEGRARAARAASADASGPEDDKRREEEEKQRKAVSLLAAARTLRETGLLEKARDKLVEALSLVPDHVGAKQELADLQKEITRRTTKADRAAGYDRWMTKALELKLAHKFAEAEEAYTRAAGFAPAGSTEARECAGQARAEALRDPDVLARMIGGCTDAELSQLPADALERALLNLPPERLDAVLPRLRTENVPGRFRPRHTFLTRGWMEMKGHGGDVRSVVFSPDGRFLATASNDATAALWEVATGRKVRTFEGHSTWVTSVAFSSDGSYVATGSEDETASLWDTSTGRRVKTFKEQGAFRSVAFSRDGRVLATGNMDMTAFLWDISTGRKMRALKGHGGVVECVAFSPDGRYLATGSWDGTAALWNATSGRRLRTFEGHKSWVNSVVFSPSGRRLATGSSDKTAALWEVKTGDRLRTFEGHTGSVYSVSFSRDGRHLATGSADGTAVVWDVEAGRRLTAFGGHGKTVWSVAFSPDGRSLVTGSADATARIWPLRDRFLPEKR